MLITQTPTQKYERGVTDSVVEWLPLQWYECNKRIQHKQSTAGRTVRLKFLQDSPALQDGHILYQDDQLVVVIEVQPCDTIVITPASILEASSICYEIGNKHLPLFYEGNDLLVPYDAPLYRLLQASGYAATIELRKLNNAIKTSVLPHGTGSTGSLFNRILQITGS